MKKIILVCLAMLLLTGCYNYRELNTLAIVSAVSISKDEDKYVIDIQIVNPKKEQDTSSSNEPDFATFESTGDSLQEAFMNVIKESPKRIYGSQMQLLIIDEELCKKGINDIIDFFARNPEIRNDFYVMIGKNKNILEILTPLDNISARNITSSLEAENKYLGTTNLVSFNDLIDANQSEVKEVVLPSVKIKGVVDGGENEDNLENTTSKTAIVLDNLGVFKKGKLIGYLNTKEAIVHNFIKDNIKNLLLEIDYKDNKYIVSEIIKSKTSIDVTPKDNKVTINIKGKAAIAEDTTSLDLTKESVIKKIEKKLNKKIEKMIKKNTYSVIDKYDVDVFNFQELYYKKDAHYFKKIKNDWNNKYLKAIKIKVKSDVFIVEQGNLLGGLKHE